jgi:branched-chain amino acid transport system substrate-binding protein
MNKKVIFGVIAVAVIALLGWYFFADKGKESGIQETVKIGAILPLTGGASYLGESIYNGIKIAEEQDSSNIKIIYEDCQADPKQAVSSYKKLQATGIKNFIPTFSSVVNSIAPLSTKTDEFLFATSVSSSHITKQNNNLYRLFVHADGDADMIADYCIDSLKAINVGIVYINDDFGKDYSNVFRTQIANRGGIVSIEIPFDKGETDFKNVVLKAKSATKCEAFYIIGYDNNLSQLLISYHTYKINKPILSIATMGQDNVRSQVGEKKISELPPIIYTTTEFAAKSISSPQKDKFLSLYKNKFNKEPDYFAAFAYDVVNIISEAHKNSATDMKGYVNNTEFRGVMGLIEFNGDRDANIKMVIEKLN